MSTQPHDRARVDDAYVANLDADRFAGAAVSAAELCAADIPKPRSLLGDGVLVAGGFGVLYGKPGCGKTWLALSIALALARGEPWLGLATPPGGVRVGILELELGAYSVQARLRMLGVGTGTQDDNLRVLCRPKLRGTVNLCDAADVAALREWVARDRLDVLIVDALSRAHTASENRAEDVGPVLAALDALRHDTGCALLPLHHERKQSTDKTRDDDLDALRGTSRLQSDPTLLMRLTQESGGLRRLAFAKVSDGREPEAVWFRLGKDGRAEVVRPPASKGDPTRERVLQAVQNARGPVARGELVEVLHLDKATVWRHLKALVEAGEVECSGRGRLTRYHAPTVAPLQSLQHDARNGEAPLIPNKMDGASGSTVAHALAGTGGHRCTVATVAPKGANGSATVPTLTPPQGPAAMGTPDPPPPEAAALKVSGKDEDFPSCPTCGGPVERWKFGLACRACHRRVPESEVADA